MDIPRPTTEWWNMTSHIYPYYPYSWLPLVSYAGLCWKFLEVEGQGSTKLDASTIPFLLAGQVSGKFCVLWLKGGDMRWQNCVSQCLISRHMRIVSMYNLQTPTIQIFFGRFNGQGIENTQVPQPTSWKASQEHPGQNFRTELGQFVSSLQSGYVFVDFARPQSLGMCPGMLQKLSVEELKVTQTLKFGGLCLPWTRMRRVPLCLAVIWWDAVFPGHHWASFRNGIVSNGVYDSHY